jgi:hypothetical protein
MQLTQIVFFVRYLLQNSGPMPIYNMYPLSYINGYNPFSSYVNVRYLDGVTMRLGLGKQFLFNVMVQVGLIGVSWLLCFVFGRRVNSLRERGS